jgi:hypothetical protein
VVAKVTRDRMMTEMDGRFPEYGFARHKGYSTPDHMDALAAHGPCREHRRSYANVIEVARRRAAGEWPAAADLAGADEEALAGMDDPDLTGMDDVETDVDRADLEAAVTGPGLAALGAQGSAGDTARADG